MSRSNNRSIITIVCLVCVVLAGVAVWRILLHRPSISANLHGVVLISSTEGWAVGDSPNGGLLMHYARNKWASIATPAGMQDLDSLIGIALDSSEDGWVIGANPKQVVNGRDTAGILLHMTNGVWQVTDRELPSIPRALALDGANDGWLAGDDGLVMHYDGTTWHQQSLPTEFSNMSFTALSLVGPHDIWLADVFGNIAHYDGHQWTRTQLGNHDVSVTAFAMTSDLSGWAFMNQIGSSQTVALHDVAGEWLPVQLPQNKGLTGLALSSDATGWAVGGGGTILKLQDGTWSAQSSATSSILNAVASTDGAAVAVGQNGVIVSYHGGAWSNYVW